MLYSGAITGFIDELEIKKIHHANRPIREVLGALDGLTASIQDSGLLQPIIVRPQGHTFEVVAGNRRLEACKNLRLRKVPCHIVELDEKEAFELAIVENLHHKTLDPIEEAKAFKKYVEDYGYGGISELAKKVKTSQAYITRRIQLLDLPAEVREEITVGGISPATAQEIVLLDGDSKRLLAREIVEKGLTRSEVRHIVKEMRQEIFEGQSIAPRKIVQERQIDRTISKCIASLKLSMSRLSDAIEDAQGDFVLREMLFEWRKKVSEQIDVLIKFKYKRRTFEKQADSLGKRSHFSPI